MAGTSGTLRPFAAVLFGYSHTVTMKSKKRPSQRQSLETDATSVPDAAFHDGFVHSGRISLMRGLLQPNDSNVSACFSEALVLSSGMGDTDVWMGRNTPTMVRVN